MNTSAQNGDAQFVSACLRSRSHTSGARPFLRYGRDQVLTYSDVDRIATSAALRLSDLGVRRGDHVLVVADRGIDAVLLWFALNFLGAVDVPVNPDLRGAMVDRLLTIVKPALLACSATAHSTISAWETAAARQTPILKTGSVIDWGEAVPDTAQGEAWCDGRGPDEAGREVSSVLFTSGSSGRPKGVMVTNAQLHTMAQLTVRGLSLEPSDVFYSAHVHFHIAPRGCVIYPAMLAGGAVYLDERFDATRWISRIRDTGATVTIAHGPMFEMIHAQAETPDDGATSLSRMGGAHFPIRIAQSFERRFCVRVVDTWGMTELGTPCWNVLSEPLRPGACGRIAEDLYEFRIASPDTDEELPDGEIGEFQLRAKVPWIVSPGYLGDAQATASAWRNGWFHSGDMGYRTPDGWIYFSGRTGDRIRRRGENISPSDIEDAALDHPDIVDASVIGVPSNYINDHDIMLFVVPAKGRTISEIDIVLFLINKLPHFMIPRYIEIRDFLPRNTTHKVSKKNLREDGVSFSTWDREKAGIRLSELYSSYAQSEESRRHEL